MSATRAFLRAFPFAWNGLAECVATQRNMRVHLVAGVGACTFAAIAPVGPGARGAILACVGVVLAAEALNTGVEAIVDLLAPEFHERARGAKDAAAGAVLAAAAASVLVGAAVVAGAWPAIRDAAPRLAWPALSGAAVAAIDAVLLASPARRRLAPAALVLGLAAGVPLAVGAADAAGVVGAALLHALAASGARASRILPDAPAA